MDEIRGLIEASQRIENKKDVIDASEYLCLKNIEEALPVLKDIFFHPLTNKEIRIEIGLLIARTKSDQIYNLLISHLILRNFSDLPAVISTIGGYEKPEIFEILVREFPTCNFESQLEIINALSKIKTTNSLEFFSKVFNGEISSANLKSEQVQQLKQRVGEALQSQIIDI